MGNQESNTAVLWRTWQRLHPLYSTLARELVIDAPPCVELESVIDVPGVENVAESEIWFATMDSRIHIHHLRHFAQTSPLMTEQAIGDLLFHFLNKTRETEGDRDKVDFLSVQLLAMRLPPKAAGPEVSPEAAMKLLGPALGSGGGEPTRFAGDLEGMIAEAGRAENLNAFFTSRVIERSRDIKQSCGAEFFKPAALAAFARFGYLIRQCFFHLMQKDLNAISDGLRELEARGVTTIDCRKAQFSVEEPITRIRMICQSWRIMFQAEYSSGQPLCLLVDLKTAVESALAKAPAAPGQLKTTAAAAGNNVPAGR